MAEKLREKEEIRILTEVEPLGAGFKDGTAGAQEDASRPVESSNAGSDATHVPLHVLVDGGLFIQGGGMTYGPIPLMAALTVLSISVPVSSTA
ncbi:MAG: hypothetical protein M1399_05355 [Actinobacteria bacterium]|nr:hypothetical protein [Actinomycetota bacterium]MCL5446540.1 hypothetical protein [Actinomycetota bacterium]